jgi:hypothetical protein
MVPEDWGKAENSISCAVMRPVSGFERPGLQWLFIAFAIVLIAVAATEAVALRRARSEVSALRAADLNARVELDQVRGQAARERAAREAFALELTRERRGGAAAEPTLTLSPLKKRGAQPPDATVGKPADEQSIQMRLLLPRGNEPAGARYTIVIRTWSGGDMVWSRNGLSMTTIDNTRMVATLITGDVFAPGAYEVALTRAASAEKATDVAAYEVAVRPSSSMVR